MKLILLIITFVLLSAFAQQSSAKSTSKVDKNEIATMTRARVYYSQKKYNKAIQLYKTISEGSDYWFESLEEQAWSYIQLGKSDLALGKIKSAVHPAFMAQLRPEPFFLIGYIHYKTCNYSSIFKVVKNFKKRFASRVNQLTKLSKGIQTIEFKKALDVYSKKDLKWEAMGSNVNHLPRLFHRDVTLQRLFKQRLTLTAGNKSIFTNNRLILSRMKSLAKIDLKELSTVIKKLHIIEAEAIQRSYVVKKVNKAPRLTNVSNAETLVFPGDKEIWLDELKYIRASHGSCDKTKEASL